MDVGPVSNVILLADSYKVGHYLMYPPDTSKLYAYFESRGGRFPYTCFFGLQYVLKRWLAGPVVTQEVIDEAKEIFSGIYNKEGVFNEAGWQYILEEHGGKLPIRIKAVPEGTVLPTKNVLFTVENTDPKVPWLTTFLETILVQVWYPMTVATISRINKQVINHFLERTDETTLMAEYMLHDCGYRGVSSVESAAIGAAANMINFKTSDTTAGTMMLRKYYGLKGVGGISGPFSEHSTVISWGKENEAKAHENVIKSFPGEKCGCVIDSYDLWGCLEDTMCGQLKDAIIEHSKTGGSFGIRPDSGDPVEVAVKCLEIVGEKYGTQTNAKGFKRIPDYLCVAIGDGVNYSSISKVLGALEEKGWSTSNVSFGSGAALLQKCHRDTLRCAYKVSQAVVEGKEIDVYKQPRTDPTKASKKGRLALLYKEGQWTTAEQGTGTPDEDQLVTVFENGELLKEYTLEEIRERAKLNENDIDIMPFVAEYD